MKFNVRNFKDVLRKATLNNSIDTVQLKFTKDNIISCMLSEDRKAVTDINLGNDIMRLKKDVEYEFNFSQISKMVTPLLNLIDEDEVDIDIKDEGVVMKNDRQRSKIFFCSPEIVGSFETHNMTELNKILSLEIDDNFMEAFSKIKRLGSRFGDVYFNVEDGVFNIETSDRSNRYSNGLKFELTEVKVSDVSLRFNFKNFLNLMAIIDVEGFEIMFSQHPEVENMGKIFTTNSDSTEKYHLMSTQMEDEF